MLKVFQYWDTGIENMPPSVKIFYEHNLALSKRYGFELIVATQNNYTDYIEPIRKFNIFNPVQQSDIFRMAALHKYGGIWLDSDGIILKDMNGLFNDLQARKYDVFLYSGRTNFPTSAFIVAKKNTVSTDYLARHYNKASTKLKIAIQPLKLHKLFENTLPDRIGLQRHRNAIHRRLLVTTDDFGVHMVRNLQRALPERMHLSYAEHTANGINFVHWKDEPAKNNERWLMPDKKSAEKRAAEVFKNTYVVLSWSAFAAIQNQKEMQAIITNKKNVFHHLMRIAREQAGIA